MEILEFINIVCEDLEIEIPEISYNETVFNTETQLALFNGSEIILRKSYANMLDAYFAIAHELRHAWQIETDEQYYLGNYFENSADNIVAYNLQIAEIDANAYAYVVMSDLFGVKPLFNGMDKNVIQAIESRANSIWNEF